MGSSIVVAGSEAAQLQEQQ
jgi:hypothetical protein